MKLPAAAVLLMAAALWSAGEAEPRWVMLNREASQAVKAKDYGRLRAALNELGPLLPGNARILYKLAAAEARLGHADAALDRLQDLAAAGLVYDFKTDEDFASLRAAPRFSDILQQVDQNRKPVSRAAPVAALSEPDLLPEDMAYDAARRRFLIGSVTRAKIVTADGKPFAKAAWPIMALRVDARRGILWAAMGWIPNCAQCDPADKDKTALVAFELDSGALIKRIDSPVKGLLGDMTISREGDLYVSEGSYGAVLRLKAGGASLERLDAPGEFPSPQTPALSADERTLYVPDYVRGIAALDLTTHAVRWLQPARGIVLNGIDGFYSHGDSFLAVQNGVTPERLVLFSQDLTKQTILETNTPGLGEPTHGTFVDDTFYFIANTGWNHYGDDGRKKDGGLIESEIRKIVLSR